MVLADGGVENVNRNVDELNPVRGFGERGLRGRF